LTTLPARRVAVRILGSRFAAGFTNAEAARAVERLWQRFVELEPSPSAHVVEIGDGPAAAQISRFATGVNAAALDAAPMFAVHAGVVARGGIAIAMPATSGTGKSTLTAACLRRGFDYVSDEALCLHYPDGEIEPYPRPIALSRWSARTATRALDEIDGVPTGDEWLFTAADLGGRDACGAAALRHIVVLERQADDGTAPDPAHAPKLDALPRPDAVTTLLRLSFNHYRRPADAVQLAAKVVAGASVWRLRYGDPHAAADLLWTALSESDR
jgi:hypothetical protein